MENNNTPSVLTYTPVDKSDFKGFVVVSPNICYVISQIVNGFYLTFRNHVEFKEGEEEWHGGRVFETLEACKQEIETVQSLNPLDASIAFSYLRVPLQD